MRLRSVLIALGILGVAAAATPIEQPREAYIQTRDFTQSKEMVVDEFDLRSGKFRQTAPLTIKGDVRIGRDAEFIPNGDAITIGEPGTDTTLYVEPKYRTVVIPAAYSGSVLLTETGSRMEMYVPSLGNIIIQ